MRDFWEGAVKNKFRFYCSMGFYFLTHTLFFCGIAQTSDVALFKLAGDAAPEIALTEIACRFYGLELQTITLDGDAFDYQQDLNFKNIPDCIILPAKTLPFLSHEPYYRLIHPKNSPGRRILIIGVVPELDFRWLRIWSEGQIDSCQTRQIGGNSFYQVADAREIARELAGQKFPIKSSKNPVCKNGFSAPGNGVTFPLITIVDNARNVELAQFIRIKSEGCSLFVAAAQDQILRFAGNWRYQHEHFFAIAPILMFLRFSLGGRCWHTVGDYANLTIDDPWLIEPYGFLSFPRLLQQMEKIRFHTTIAFIPWNFDRNHPEVISLLRQHPDNFSICVHGNNHDHREFWKYQGQSMPPGQAKSLQLHEQNIRQALARMQAFRRITGLEYDRVMVFPHAIAPEQTLGLLKKYHFLATFNSGNVPIGAQPPDDPTLRLRSIAIQYENLPSYHRFEASSQEIVKNQFKIAVDLFLDNPVLLFGHHDLFQRGANAFNATASFINRIQPQVRWLGLADIARQAYLIRQGCDNNYDVLAFSREFILANPNASTVRFRIRKPENFNPLIQSFTVDGVPQSFDSLASEITFALVLKPGEQKKIVIGSSNVPDLDSVSIFKNTRYQNVLRHISDFRDLTLSANGLGRGMSRFYTETGLVRTGPLGVIVIILVVNLIFLVTAIQIRARKSENSGRKKSGKIRNA